jgi:bifunctional non-homologous end joining protein LigD
MQSPQLASVTDKPPITDGWISELKWDGYRLIVRIQNGKVHLLTRNGHDWTNRMPSLASRFLDLNVENAMIDGELVALKPDGRDSFHDLQRALSEGRDNSLYFYAFDLLHLDGFDLRRCALLDRKSALEAVTGWSEHLRYAQHVVGAHETLLAAARRMRLEGSSVSGRMRHTGPGVVPCG